MTHVLKPEPLGERNFRQGMSFCVHSSSTVYIVLNYILASYSLFRCALTLWPVMVTSVDVWKRL